MKKFHLSVPDKTVVSVVACWPLDEIRTCVRCWKNDQASRVGLQGQFELQGKQFAKLINGKVSVQLDSPADGTCKVSSWSQFLQAVPGKFYYPSRA